MKRLKKRAEFLSVARGARSARRAFVLQTARLPDETTEPRCGFTVSKKVGNAVVRNRVRRRLKEAIRLDGERLARPGFDHVVIGRREALSQPFSDLRADLAGAFRQGRKDRRGGDAATTPDRPAAPRPTHRDARGETPGRTR